ncbi:MAG: hypothetical protein ISS92_06735 [Candidatus Omnitrophica bacterium]|nr:hypothetical protein [Candidatus Omnitrophota bacterium]
MLGKTSKAILAVLFIPFAIGVTQAFLKSFDSIGLFNIKSYVTLLAGFFAYPIMHIIFTKPMYIYALGHEIVHVLATWISGGKVISFSVTHEGGNVTTTKTNFFIQLAPYFVPIHTIALFLLYWILSQFYDMGKFSQEFVFLVGFSLSFHIFMTIEVMKMRQPDILKAGYIFSILFIYVANIFIALLVVSSVFRDVSFVSFAKNTWNISKGIYVNVFDKIFR